MEHKICCVDLIVEVGEHGENEPTNTHIPFKVSNDVRFGHETSSFVQRGPVHPIREFSRFG